jgi:hypothetical protein
VYCLGVEFRLRRPPAEIREEFLPPDYYRS